jgi:hypothetical protein
MHYAECHKVDIIKNATKLSVVRLCFIMLNGVKNAIKLSVIMFCFIMLNGVALSRHILNIRLGRKCLIVKNDIAYQQKCLNESKKCF